MSIKNRVVNRVPSKKLADAIRSYYKENVPYIAMAWGGLYSGFSWYRYDEILSGRYA